VLLERILKNWGVRVWIELNWLRIRCNCVLMWMQQWTVSSHKRRKISWIPKRMSSRALFSVIRHLIAHNQVQDVVKVAQYNVDTVLFVLKL
jgi:hypothetical protein